MQKSKVSVKYSEENFVFISLSYQNLFNFFGGGVGWGGALIQINTVIQIMVKIIMKMNVKMTETKNKTIKQTYL